MASNESTRARRQLIVEAVTARGGLSFSEIRDLVQPPVSGPTLRNDINMIIRLPVLCKDPRGGLRIRPRSVFENTYFGVNLGVKTDEKDQLARRLVLGEPAFPGSPLINLHGDTLVIGPGTSTLAVLRVLADYPSVEILTPNLGVLEIPDLLLRQSLHFSGGWVLSSVASLVGVAAVRNINAFGAHSAIVGVSGLCIDERDDHDILLYCHQEAQLPVKKALIDGRKKVIVVTCGEKLGLRDAHPFCSLSQILSESDFYLFTDSVDQNTLKELADRMNELANCVNKGHVAKIIELRKT
jgi:DeoR/GlpR family transcriptional regulator of sugar metabolism